jgi:DNA-directed RNA polymerase specialized sigma subunit
MIDYERLAKSNALQLKWAEKLKIAKNDYLSTMIKINMNKEAFIASLPAKKRRQFIKDMDKMFYAAEIENELITQYRPAVFHLIRRFKVLTDEVRNELESLGYQSLRSAVWRYSMSHIKFITFAFNGMIGAFRGELSRKSTARKYRKFASFSVINEQQDMIIASKRDNPALLAGELTFDDLVKGAKLNNAEIEMLDFYMEKSRLLGFKWIASYGDALRKRNEKVLHRSELTRKMNTIKKKIVRHLIRVDPERYDSYRKILLIGES